MHLNEFVYELICITIITLISVITLVHILLKSKKTNKKIMLVNNTIAIDLESVYKITLKIELKEPEFVIYYKDSSIENLKINSIDRKTSKNTDSEIVDYIEAYDLFNLILRWKANKINTKESKIFDVGILK